MHKPTSSALFCALCLTAFTSSCGNGPGEGTVRSNTITTGAAGPLGEHMLAGQDRFGFEAKVEERLPAGGYLYLRVRDALGRSHWVATLRAFAPSSPEVRVWVMARAGTFHSRRLERDFEPLLFASVRPSGAPGQ